LIISGTGIWRDRASDRCTLVIHAPIGATFEDPGNITTNTTATNAEIATKTGTWELGDL